MMERVGRIFQRHVPARPELTWNDLVGGHVDFFCEQAVSVAPQISGGAIKAYAMSGSERLAALPDIPTAREAGVDYQMSIWAGIFAPKGTSKEIIGKLATALDKALDDRALIKRIADLGGSLPSKQERQPAKFPPRYFRFRRETRKSASDNGFEPATDALHSQFTR